MAGSNRIENGSSVRCLKLESSLRTATINVRGLRNEAKLLGIVKKLKEEKLDILAIQETHLVTEQEINNLSSRWGGIVHYSPGTNRSKGVATLFGPKHTAGNVKFIKSYDRIVFSRVHLDSENIMIVNVYSPCDIKKDKLSFLAELQKKILHHLEMEGIDDFICLGDFNITRCDKDILIGNSHDKDVRLTMNDFIETLGLIDTWRIGHPDEKTFTWRNTRSARRLDYLFSSESLSPYISESYIKGIGFTDHRLMATHFEFSTFNHGKGYYKLNTELLKDTDYCNMMIQTINDTCEECKDLNPNLRLEMIKCNVSEVSQQYSRYKQRNKRLNNNNLTKRLNDLEKQFIDNPDDNEVQEKISRVKAELEIYEMEKAKGAQIRAGCKDIMEGEKCTRYFLSLEKNRSENNIIKRIKSSNNEFICGENEIVQEIASQFEAKYNKDSKSYDEVSQLFDEYIAGVKLPSLNEQEKTHCDRELMEQEVLKALKLMKADSAPGTDGIPVEFYQMFWRQLKAPLLSSYHYSNRHGHMSHSERVGVISLIHKGKELPTYILSNWRPISLTNVDYKILAKVFSLRTDSVIQKLVGDQQTGFMKGRNIAFLHRQIDDVMSIYRKSNTPGILLAIDFRQAFDTLNVNCILKSLKAFGFGPNFIRWIRVLNTDRLSCIKNGGHISGYFNMKNGVRQGCPISPQLFVLAVEILAQKIIQDVDIKGLSMYHSGKPVKIQEYADDKIINTNNSKELKRARMHIKSGSHFSNIYQELDTFFKPIKISQYADDTSLFLRDTDDMRRALAHVNAFSKFSDLYLNMNKSFAISTNGSRIDTGDLEIKFKDTIKILGIYFSNKKPASEIEENWTDRVNKVIRIFGQWSKRRISILGKLLIVKTFALSQFIFIMKSLTLPKEVLENINRLFFQFVWSNGTSKGREAVKRTVMCNDLSAGGLKMINMHTLQDSILLEWAEKLTTDEGSAWKIMPMYFYSHLGGINIFRSNTMAKNFKGIRTIESTFWREVLIKWLDNSGNHLKKTTTVLDPLNNNDLIKHRGNNLFLESSMKGLCFNIQDMMDGNRVIRLTEYRHRFGKYPGYFLDYFTIFNAIRHFRVTDIAHDRKFYFKGIVAGKLGRKKLYSLMMNEEKPLCEDIWKRKFNIDIGKRHWDLVHSLRETRLKSLAWKIMHNIYPTNVTLCKMKIKPNHFCSFCQEDMDTLEHFFFSCVKVRPLWEEVTKEINMYMGIKITLDEKIVLLGSNLIKNISKKQTLHINKVINIAKMSISKFKNGPKRPILDIYLTDTNVRRLWSNFH